MTTERHIVFGPPGTGKTTRLLRIVEEALARGVDPSRIGFVSFSRRAIAVATDRARALTDADLPFFRTIHSTAYQLLGLARGDVLQPEHLADFGRLVGLPFGDAAVDLPVWEGSTGDRILALAHLAKARQTSLDAEWRRANVPDLPWALVASTVALYEHYKHRNGLWDFADMIEQADGTLPLDLLLVDEAQDTSRAQWALLRRVAAGVPVVYLAGDDDQAVYHWSGAEPEQLLRFKGARAVLPTSHRLPPAVKAVADRITARIRVRVPKAFAAREGEPGAVRWAREVEGVDLHASGSHLLLARSNYQLSSLRKAARQQGVVYNLPDGRWSWELPAVEAARSYEALRKGKPLPAKAARNLAAFWPGAAVPPAKGEVLWEDMAPGGSGASRAATWLEALTAMSLRDREYIRALRRSGERLGVPGRVRVGTVHSAKGEEADHVTLVTDVSERVATAATVDPDAEARVQYVGVTRARQTLTLLMPFTAYNWSF